MVKEKEVGKNPNPTTCPSTRSSTIKKDTATTNADLKTIVLKKQVGKKSITPPTRSTAGIANDKIVSGKKSNPTATKSTGSFPFFKKFGGEKCNPTPTKSSAVTTAKATKSQNLESKMTELKMTKSSETKSKKSTVVTTAKATESQNLESKMTELKTTESNETKSKKSTAVTIAKATESQNLESKTTETQMTKLNVTKSKNKSTAGSITMKTPSKKRVTKNQSLTASQKRIKIDDATSVNVEATVVKDTSKFTFHFTAGNTPLQKLHQILNYSRVSPDNPKQTEIAHFVDEQGKHFGITYIEFLRHQNNEYMGCEVINGFMFLLREQFNNGGKNRFFPNQFFPAVLDEKISRENSCN
jgi:hypothetical protein